MGEENAFFLAPSSKSVFSGFGGRQGMRVKGVYLTTYL
jgi:hypothetical protein